MTMMRAQALSLAATLAAGAVACSPAQHAQWLTQSELAATREAAVEFPDAPAVALIRSRQFSFHFGEGESWTRVRHHEAVEVRNEAGKALADMRIPLPGAARFLELRARTISPDGNVVEVRQDQMTEERAKAENEHEAFSVRIFRFPNVQVGSVLEFSYDALYPWVPPSIDEQLALEIPVQRYELKMRVPGRIRFDFNAFNIPNPLTRTEGADFTELALSMDHIDRAPAEWASPDWTFDRPWWSFRVRQVTFGRWASQPTSTWAQSLSLWAKKVDSDPELYAGFEAKLPSDGCAEAATRCRVEAAVRWVRERTRPSEFGSWEGVRPLKEVLEGVTATGWEQAILLRRLLVDAGVHAELAPTTRILSRLVDPNYVDTQQLNHALVYVPKQEGLPGPLWIDPICVHCALGEIPDWVNGASAIPLPKEPDAQVSFLRASGQPTHRREARYVFNVQLDASGDADVTYEIATVGDHLLFDAMRRRTLRPDELESEIRQVVQAVAPTGKVISFEPSRCDEAHATCTVSVRFKVANFATPDGSGLLIPLTLFDRLDQENLREERRTDLHFPYDHLEEEIIRVKLPEGFRIEKAPPSVHTELQGFGVSFIAGRTTEGFMVRRQFEWARGVYDAADWPELREVLQAYQDVPGILVSATRASAEVSIPLGAEHQVGAPP